MPYTGRFWRGRYLFVAFNEGGMPPLAFNLKLKDGWLPVGFYLAIGIGRRWLHLTRGFTL
jgi:hypothetical protein